MGELPSVQRERLQAHYGLASADADVLVNKGRPMVAYFEELAKLLGDGKAAANRLADLVYPALTERREDITEFPLRPADVAAFVKATGPASKQDRADLFKYVLDKGVNVEQRSGRSG